LTASLVSMKDGRLLWRYVGVRNESAEEKRSLVFLFAERGADFAPVEPTGGESGASAHFDRSSSACDRSHDTQADIVGAFGHDLAKRLLPTGGT
jgi:hypothetical protein